MSDDESAEHSEATGSAVRGNGYDPDAVRSFVDRVENVRAEIDEIMTAAKLECGPKYEDIAVIKTEAHDAGLPRKAFNAILSERRALRRANGIRESLSSDDQDRYDNLKLALGDFGEAPLGAAALDKAKPAHGQA